MGRNTRWLVILLSAVSNLVPVSTLVPLSAAQKTASYDRGNAELMLKTISGEIRKHYYDTKLHQVDWDAVIAEAKRGVDKANSMNAALSYIAQAIDSLDDSHTFMLPPEHAYRYAVGFKYQMFDTRCLITQVRPNSDAQAKGLKPGDEIVQINGFSPTRDTLWKLQYMFGVLRPQATFHLKLRDTAGQERDLEIAAKVRQLKKVTDLTVGENGGADIWDIIRNEETAEHLTRIRYAEFGDQLLVVKFPAFDFGVLEVQGVIDKARKHKAMILDLRDNGGGSEDTLKAMVGGLFDKEVKIADRVSRTDKKPLTAKPLHHVFDGDLIVLVDSNSASASELLARVVQLQKRGAILGDHSSGSVMEAKHYQYQLGSDTIIFYGASITEADLIMSDGKSLEHVGVQPDQLLITSPTAIAAGRDPVLAFAAGKLGVKLDAQDAGKLFPYEWAPE